MKSIGIVVPIRNMAGKLQNLESWLATCIFYPQIRVYIVHDREDHQTWIELNQLIKKLGNTNLHLSECFAMNPGGTRNLGLSQSKEDYIVFWDSDDLGYVSNLINAVENSGEFDVLICNFEMCLTDLTNRVAIRHGSNFSKVSRSPGLWRFVLKREFIQKFRFDELNMGEDQLFLERLNIQNSKYKFTDAFIYCYISNQKGSLTYSKNVTDLKSVIYEGVKILKLQNRKNSKFSKAMIRRQCVSLIRYGAFHLKIYGITIFLKLFFTKIHVR